MADYISLTERERNEMLAALGAGDEGQLFSDIPRELLRRKVGLSKGRTQKETESLISAFAARNKVYKSVFAGAGCYRHYIPAAVSSIVSREEFLTAYTPYQPEISQGVLQAMFEYQTMMCELTGMDVSNASHYSGASAAAEACLMCFGKKRRVAVYDNVDPDTLETIATYVRARGGSVAVIPSEGGKALPAAYDADAVYLESPNYFGLIEDISAVAQAAHAEGCRVIAGCNPVALALFRTPAECGADIAVGDGQPLGLPMSFGGPSFGFITAKQEFMRKLPGRIVGETTDAEGRRAYVLTLQAREQHIRREKAASNICSNQAHCALTAAVYLSLVGAAGLRAVAETSAANAHYLAEKLAAAGAPRVHEGEFFHEFVTSAGGKAAEIAFALDREDILCGPVLSRDSILWCCTEMNDKADMDRVADIVREVLA